MDNFRYLLVAIAALTLIMSVVSSVNPSYFAGLNAFADHDDEDNEDSDDNSGSSNDDDEDNDDDKDDEDEEKIVKTLGNNSKVALEIDDDAELQVEIEDGDLDNGTYNVLFACDSPDVDEEFEDGLVVKDGDGKFKEDLSLTNGTYSGCEIEVGDLSATFPSFTIAANEEDDEEDDDNSSRGHKEDDRGSSRGSNDDDKDDDEDDGNNSGRGSDDEEEEDDDDGDDDKRKERKQRIVNSTSGSEIHKRHRGENAASPGDYKPGWNYTLEAEGEAAHTAHNDDENLTHEANVTASVDMSVWKSNRAIILFDIVDGTIEVEGQDYDVRIGYAIYSIQHDAMKVAALATDDDGNVFRLKLRGSAVDGSDQFPMETGSIDMVFGGDVNDRFEDWNLLLEGTIEAN